MTSERRTLPVPDYFRFQWQTPEEAARFWSADLMHWPRGISRLGATLDMPAFRQGMARAVEALSMPFSDLRFKYINGYVYTSALPIAPSDLPQRLATMQQRMQEHIPGLYERWQTVYEPEVRSINDDTLKGDYSKLSDSDLADLIEQVIAKREREGELHFLAVFPAMGAVQVYEQVYEQLFGTPRASEHLQLLQGFDNKSLEAGIELWYLAREARKKPFVMQVLQSVDADAVDEALKADPQGRAFRGAMESYLDNYGWRGNEMDIAAPTWRESPATAYRMLREYASRDDYDPVAEAKSLASAREARQKMLIDKVSGVPEAAEMFRQVLAGAQQYLPIQEDHNFWIDQQGVAVERVPVLEAAGRLVASGRLAARKDVFELDVTELLDALRGSSADLKAPIEERRREQARLRGLQPPPVLGTTPAPGEEVPSVMTKFFGAPPEQSPDPRIIPGNGASAGTVTATARVILELEDSHRLSAGEILVCPATMPPWTPLFGLASAVVTDHGGILSHTAIVAREYQIPAVVGTKIATTLIKDGQTVTVDGDAGTVRLEE